MTNQRFGKLAPGCFLLLIVLLAASSAPGQGIMVKPMKIEMTPPTGETTKFEVEIRNTGTEAKVATDLKLYELIQDSSGSWAVVEGESKVDVSQLCSCLKWIKLGETSPEIKPGEAVAVPIELAVPRTARGFYTAGLIVQTKPPTNPTGLTVVVRFLVPILVEIPGRPLPQKIVLADSGLCAVDAQDKNPATTLADLAVNNEGKTYSRIKGSVKVERSVQGHWRPVCTLDFRECGILPGMKLDLKSDLKRRLPSGKYKLTANLMVGGRQVKPLEKEIDFVGDPNVTKLATDTSLMLEPATISVCCVPGSMRTATVKVENASDDQVNIAADMLVPAPLRNAMMGEIKGDDLACNCWVTVEPASFSLRAGEKRTIRLIAKMPKADAMPANYFTTLSLKATYADGQSAGETTSLVCVENKSGQAKPAATATRMAVALDEGDKYVVQCAFANTGNVQFEPRCKLAVTDASGKSVTDAALYGPADLMLPLETRNFSGIVDIAKLDAGIYKLNAALDFAAGQQATHTLSIRVSEEEGHKVMTVLQPKEEPATQPKQDAH